MSAVITLEAVELVPVLELEPAVFRTRDLPWQPGGLQDPAGEQYRYWSDSLADSGITGLTPLRRGSWFVPTTEFTDPATLRRVLDAVFRHWGGIETLSDPDCEPVLSGGLALRCPSRGVLIEPGCCADLGDAANWRAAAACRQVDWQMLWIGHPWLSVRYQAPWLVLSDGHESSAPEACWAVCPDELRSAAAAAESELERFARQIGPKLVSLGYSGDPLLTSRKLAGLPPRPVGPTEQAPQPGLT